MPFTGQYEEVVRLSVQKIENVRFDEGGRRLGGEPCDNTEVSTKANTRSKPLHCNFTAQIPWFFPVFNFRSRDYYSYCTCVWSVTNRWGLQWIKGDVFSGLTGWQWKRISSPLCGPMIRSWLIIVAIVVIIMCLRTAVECPAWIIHWKSLQRVKARKEKEKDQKSWGGDWVQLPDSHFTWRILTNGWLTSAKIDD